MTFKQMNISEPVCRALLEKNYSTPTLIQEQAIPEALTGRDLLGLAQTGTGKTAAFAIPIIEQLLADPTSQQKGAPRKIRALILTPTRELAIQIDESLADYTRYTTLRHTVIFGGVKQKSQTDELRAGTDILTATPGRLLDLMSQGFIRLDHVRHFVLDEADRMLDMGFIHDVKRLLPKLPPKKQTLFFSATMPDSIDRLAKSLLRNPARVEVTPASSVVEIISQSVYRVEKPQKKELLAQLLLGEAGHQVLVFSRTKHGADNIARYLSRRGITCESIHGDKSQNSRQRALSNFKEGRSNVIIATDIAARGIDIKGLDLVLNYDLPDVPETYVHRIGRTGRAGCEGRAIAFCSGEEASMLREIEKLTGIKLEQRKHDLPPLEETKTTPIANARKVQAKAPAEKQQGKQNNKRREGRKPAEPLKNTQQATVVAEKPKRHNRPAKPKLVREPQQKQSADKPEQASSRSAKLRSRYENYE
ncbi:MULTISPECIES: DEAD/DEAH box helicase [Bacteroides]|uniref:DEAD/DEAH box helicase n=1 Tax=Bacteroides TaxID=816 RepID=UPI000E471BC5|nr:MULTISPECIES: DEAD/DEAH box helicase [Bacteroides]RHL05343.1 ATP-dependent helicase [Bacteroides sp. AF39-11AC]